MAISKKVRQLEMLELASGQRRRGKCGYRSENELGKVRNCIRRLILVEPPPNTCTDLTLPDYLAYTEIFAACISNYTVITPLPPKELPL